MTSLLFSLCLPRCHMLSSEGQSGVEEEDVAQAGQQVDMSRGVPTKLPNSIHRAQQTSLGMGLSDLRYFVLVLLKHQCHYPQQSGSTGPMTVIELNTMSPLTRRRRLLPRSALLLPPTFPVFQR